MIERSLRYTSERQALAKGRDNDDDLAARAVFFSVADAPKLWQPLAELLRVVILVFRPPTVTDSSPVSPRSHPCQRSASMRSTSRCTAGVNSQEGIGDDGLPQPSMPIAVNTADIRRMSRPG